MKEQVYEVLARCRRGDPLQEIGSVRAGNAALAGVYAELIYDEENFSEMCVVCRSALDWVRRAGHPTGEGGDGHADT